MKNQSIQNSKNIIQLEGVSYKRKDKTILHNVNWSIKQGEHWSLVGLNGSGKSTLINILSGYSFPSTGKVCVLGEEFGKTSIPELRKRIGIVSNWINQKLPKHFNVLDTIISGRFASFGLFQSITTADKNKAHDLLKEFGFENFTDRKINSLSQGEMQKVLILRALMTDPKLLILDEPTNSLDLFAKEELLSFIENLAEHNPDLSILLITHHIEEIITLFSQTALLKNGQIFKKGTTRDLIQKEILQEFYEKPVQVKPYTANRIQVIPD